jgi:hypothetical protein
MRAEPVPSMTVARWLAGPLVWTAHFLIVYASESLVCSRGGGAALHLGLVAAASVAGLLVLLAVTPYSWRAGAARGLGVSPGRAFMDRAAVALGLLGMLGLIWTALPAMLLSSCSPPA